MGLGFVIPLAQRSRLQTILTGRTPPQNDDQKRELCRSLIEDKRYYLRFFGNNDRHPIDILDFFYYDKNIERLFSVVADPETVLLTTSVFDKGLRDLAPLIAGALANRQKKTENDIYIIACENPPADSKKLQDYIYEYIRQKMQDDQLLTFLDTKVHFLKSIVDRVCTREKNSPANEVQVEQWSEWFIECLSPITPPKFLVDSAKMIHSEKEFLFYEKRKAWLVNGTHYALALYGWASTMHYRVHEILKEKYLLENVKKIQEAFVHSLNYYATKKNLSEDYFEHIKVTSLNDYAQRIIERFLNGPNDNIAKILKVTELDEITTLSKFRTSLRDCDSFLQKSIVRLNEPFNETLHTNIKYFQENPGNYAYIAECFSLIVRLLEKVLIHFNHQFEKVHHDLIKVMGN